MKKPRRDETRRRRMMIIIMIMIDGRYEQKAFDKATG
jgi:hypothetical protein